MLLGIIVGVTSSVFTCYPAADILCVCLGQSKPPALMFTQERALPR
jgi:hypothetical protein